MTTTTEPTDALTTTRLLLGADLRSARRRAGVTAAQLGRMVGACESAICRWEAGTRAPRPRHLLRLAAVLGQLANKPEVQP